MSIKVDEFPDQPGFAPATIQPWDDERREFIRRNFCANAPDTIVEPFLRLCERRGLSPEEKHVYLVNRGGKWVTQTGIDGYRYIADRTRTYAGSDKPRFNFMPDIFDVPDSVEVTVYKMVQGQRCPFTAVAYWDEYAPEDLKAVASFMWKKMPKTMLAKCAEAQALRKAFPNELAGLYTDEEMAQAGPGTIVEEPLPPEPPKGKRPKALKAVEPTPEVIETTGTVVEPEHPADAALAQLTKEETSPSGGRWPAGPEGESMGDANADLEKERNRLHMILHGIASMRGLGHTELRRCCQVEFPYVLDKDGQPVKLLESMTELTIANYEHMIALLDTAAHPDAIDDEKLTHYIRDWVGEIRRAKTVAKLLDIGHDMKAIGISREQHVDLFHCYLDRMGALRSPKTKKAA